MAQSWWQLNWIWTTTAWTLAILGGLLLLWALFSDRSRSRRRCPRCWYDMTGVPGHAEPTRESFTCPECGRSTILRRLHRTRRKWRTFMLAALVLLCAWGAASWRDYAAGGWVRTIPSTAIAFWAPTEFSTTAQRAPLLGGIPLVGSAFGPPGPLPANERIGQEAWRRVYAGSLWKWQSQIFVGRALRHDKVDLARRIYAAPVWREGEPVPVLHDGGASDSVLGLACTFDPDAHVPWWDKQGNAIALMPQGTGPTREILVPLALRTSAGHTVYTFQFHRETTVAPEWPALFRLDATDETSRRIMQAMDPRLFLVGEELSLVLNDRSNSPPWPGLKLGMGCRVEVSIDGEPAAAGAFRPQWARPNFQASEELPIEWKVGMKARALSDPSKVRVLVRGDVDISAEMYRYWPFIGDPACWTGMFETTPRIVVRPNRFAAP
jgi:hypothetical protein